jgi:hypothetical protein
VMGSLLHTALGRDAGPRLLLPDGPPVRWASGLQEADPAAVVLAEDGPLLHPWGPVPQALLYLVLTDVGRGRFARAERALIRAARLGGDRIPLLYDPDRLPVTAAQVAARADAFRTRLLYPDPDRGPALGGADLATLWDRLLRICLEDAPENTGD